MNVNSRGHNLDTKWSDPYPSPAPCLDQLDKGIISCNEPGNPATIQSHTLGGIGNSFSNLMLTHRLRAL
jgi:hypothetical protein